MVAAATIVLMFSGITAVSLAAQEKGDRADGLNTARGARAIEGSWTVAVTSRVCATGEQVPNSIPFRRLITFMQGGTTQEFAAAVSPARRSPGHGIWSHQYERNFEYAIQFMRFDENGVYAGYVVERRNVEVSPDGSTFSATGTASIYLPNGVVLGPFCATEEASRFE